MCLFNIYNMLYRTFKGFNICKYFKMDWIYLIILWKDTFYF